MPVRASLPDEVAPLDDVPAGLPCGATRHTVEFFDRAAYPAEAIAADLAGALARGHGVVVLAPAAHLAAIRAAIAIDRRAAGAVDGQLVAIDAEEVHRALAEDPGGRESTLEAVLARPLRDLVERHGRVRAHGELVDALCRAGDREGALAVERWWNALLDGLPVELHCAYGIEAFADHAAQRAFDQICDHHERVIARADRDATARAHAKARQLASIVEAETERRSAAEAVLATAHASERQLREHLVILQRITSALSEAVTHDDLGRVVTMDLALALDATHLVLAIDGELIAIRGATTPEDPPGVAAALAGLPARWTEPASHPPELRWLGGTALGVAPLTIGSVRRGTLVLGFRRPFEGPARRALVEDLARQLAIAIDRADIYELARRERARAEAASAAKDRVLAMLGHELRNPLSPILTATQLMRLRAPELLERERATIERSVDQLMRVVDDLLDVARLTHGKITLTRSPCDLGDVVAHALELASGALGEHAHRVHVDLQPHLIVDADRERLAQVFSKLLANAAKHTRRGGSIEVTSHATDARIEIAVIDDGAGIAPGLLPHVFDPFRARPAGERGRAGLGVGLAIARALVELHGGTIAASSSGPDRGSRFTVSLPRWVPPPGADTPRIQPRSRGRRVLVVDDNEDAAWLLAEALQHAGHVVQVCHDGAEALERARGFLPEIGFLDIGLPGMDGYALCEQLRALLPIRPKLVAVTGYGQRADRERAFAAGFDLHFVKPVSLREVHDAIEALRS